MVTGDDTDLSWAEFVDREAMRAAKRVRFHWSNLPATCDVDDMAGAAALKVCEQGEDYFRLKREEQGHWGALQKALRNACLDAITKELRHGVTGYGSGKVRTTTLTPADVAKASAQAEADVTALLLARSRAEAVRKAYKQLPPQQLAVIIATYEGRLTQAQIAEESGRAVRTVQKDLALAKARLAELLDPLR